MSEIKEKVFISYSEQDSDIAQKLCNELESKGYDCFIYERDATLVTSFIDIIVEAIEQSFVMFLVASKNTNKSDYVFREVKYASENKIPIFSLRIEDVQLSKKLKFLIGSTSWLDIFKKPLESYFPQIVGAVDRLYKESEAKKTNHDTKKEPTITIPKPSEVKTPPSKNMDTALKNIFRNPFEDNVEYILIPGGTYRYSVTREMETVPNLYFCKYPVTNKRYNRFVSYLEGREIELEKILPLEVFQQRLKIFFEFIDGFKDYLGKDTGIWKEKLRSQNSNKKFIGDDLPVIGVTWYHARSYCFWLSCLDAGLSGDNGLDNVRALSDVFRLPNEVEWEWAAGGEPDGTMRKYPWAKEKGEPHSGLANYGGHVNATTPVGRYPEGATPLGLMDMAGNVGELMINNYSKISPYPSLRGGSWDDNDDRLLCSAHTYLHPINWNDDFGFRVIRTIPNER